MNSNVYATSSASDVLRKTTHAQPSVSVQQTPVPGVDHAIAGAASVGIVASIMARPSARPAMMIAGVIVGVGLLCAVVVLYRRMKTYSASLADIHAKIDAKLDTLARLTESDGEALVDEPLPVEDLQEDLNEEEEEGSMYVIQEEEEEEDAEEDDFSDEEERPRVEELPSPPPPPPIKIAPTPKKKVQKKPPKEKTVVFDLDAVLVGNSTPV